MKLAQGGFPIFGTTTTGPTGKLSPTSPLYIVDLFIIGPMANGQFIYACNGTGDITLSANTIPGQLSPVTFHSQKYGQWSRGSIKVKIGLESNGTQITVITGQNLPVIFPGTSATLLNDGIKFGLMGDAPVTIATAYMVKYGVVPNPPSNTGGVIVQFQGMVTDIDPIGFTKAVINVQDMLYLLNMKIPNRIVQASCSWVLYSAGCTLASTSFTRTATVGTISQSYLFSPVANLTPISAAGTFTQGTLKWLTGNNNGLASFVRLWTPGGSGADQIQLDVAPIFPVASGDTFTITEGCDKSFQSCTNLQGGRAPYNFGGQPDTPVPETAL